MDGYPLWMLKFNFLLANKLVVYLDGNEDTHYILGEVNDDGRWWVNDEFVEASRLSYQPFRLDFNLYPFEALLEALE